MLIGLGYEMHGDDEIGLEVVRRWSEEKAGRRSGEEIQTILLDSPGINLLGFIAGLDAAILVAAIQSGAPLGSIQVIQDPQITALEGLSRKGGGRGAAETLSLGQQLAPEELPKKLTLIGIEGAAFGLGEGLSPAVQAAIPDALTAVEKALKGMTRKGISLRGIFTWVSTHLRKNSKNRPPRQPRRSP